MELDELKSLWQHHDKQLEDHLKINEQILRQMKLNRTNREFRKLIYYEISSVILGFLCIPFLVYFTSMHIHVFWYAACGIISVCVMSMYLIFSMLRLSGLSRLCGYDESIVKVQKELAIQKKRMLRFRKIEFIVLPLLVATLFPLLVKSIHHYDIYLYPVRYLIFVAIACMLAIILAIWVNRVFYDKSIASAETLLQSINDFEENK